jgi:cytidyltransferase-like protein
MARVVLSVKMDQVGGLQMRWLAEAAAVGEVHVLLWTDALIAAVTGAPPKLPFAERRYLLESLRWVAAVEPLDAPHDPETLPPDCAADFWVVCDRSVSEAKRAFCAGRGIELRHLPDSALGGFPEIEPPPSTGRPKVIVTGCYDWFHSGHVRFFEEASEHGELYVVVGSDANVGLLKGPGHPLFSQDERRFIVGSVRFVHQALVSTGTGWMDAAPEIERLQPQIYLVNEDGDKPEKQAFCDEHGLRYVVLRRLPKEGLTARQSTDLRGF